ncbi:hypothetical protein POX_c04273 [Penicillium oxalicum]|uniref:Uncharacterized protein n=1 Tax=Penicillium oxalicum (strain 114-2 / CGMCC 5302) TaxID=933388 RepID=S7ZB48_PENO1|nr:hypothetical protein POX_c04273 [Penicillium oxalicum]EPS25896.1 hypothetical protein PDE_00832 [Penicillium oxalicum 114-2]KAI2791413.1 hypothetical protein POX_c04273 [Penicillium oxalicum]
MHVPVCFNRVSIVPIDDGQMDKLTMTEVRGWRDSTDDRPHPSLPVPTWSHLSAITHQKRSRVIQPPSKQNGGFRSLVPLVSIVPILDPRDRASPPRCNLICRWRER